MTMVYALVPGFVTAFNLGSRTGWRNIVLLIVLLGSTTAMGFGQRRTLSIRDAVHIAIKQNKDLEVARLGIQKADAQVLEARGNALPSLNVGAQYNRNIKVPVFFIPNFQDPSAGLQAVEAGLANSYSVSASASQVLFNAAVFRGIGASRIYADAAREQYRSTAAGVVTETLRRYYGALAAKEFVTIAESTLNNAEQNYATVDALFGEGLVAEFDHIRARVAVDNIRPQVTQARAAYATATAALLTYLSMNIADSVDLSPDGLADPTAVANESDAIQQALANNYSIQALEMQLQVLDELVALNQSAYYPALTAIGNWQNFGQSAGFDSWLSASTAFVGVNLSFNVFNGFQTMAKVEQATADYLQAEQQLANLKNVIQLQVRASINDLQSALERITAQQSTVEQAQRGFDIARIRYTEGTGSLLEINDAETALARARVNRLQALYDYYLARAQYDLVTGSISEELLSVAE